MKSCVWEEILGFRNRYEFNKFTTWLSNQIDNKIAEEVSVEMRKLQNEYIEKWFIHKESGEKWKLLLTDGPPFVRSFRSFSNQDNCPWNEIKGKENSTKASVSFKNYEDFEEFHDWLEKQVELGIAVVETPQNEEKWGEKNYVHIPTGSIWKLIWPDLPLRPSFERIGERGTLK